MLHLFLGHPESPDHGRLQDSNVNISLVLRRTDQTICFIIALSRPEGAVEGFRNRALGTRTYSPTALKLRAPQHQIQTNMEELGCCTPNGLPAARRTGIISHGMNESHVKSQQSKHPTERKIGHIMPHRWYSCQTTCSPKTQQSSFPNRLQIAQSFSSPPLFRGVGREDNFSIIRLRATSRPTRTKPSPSCLSANHFNAACL